MNLFAGVEELDREAVFVEQCALQFVAAGGDNVNGFIFLGEFLHGFADSLGEPPAGIANRVCDIVERTRRPRRGEIGTEAAALPFEHVTSRTGSLAEEKFTAALRIA